MKKKIHILDVFSRFKLTVIEKLVQKEVVIVLQKIFLQNSSNLIQSNLGMLVKQIQNI